ncbi:unnamed protein product, partial [Prorocentrum cordatum]
DRLHNKRPSAERPSGREEDHVHSATYSRSYSSSYGRSHQHFRSEGHSKLMDVQPE